VTDPLDADYEAAGFRGHLGWGQQPALLVVDICRAYLDRDSALYAGVEDAVASAARLVDAARTSGVPVVFTKVEYEPGGADGGFFYRKVGALASFDRGNPLGDWVDQCRPIVGEIVVTKQYASAFFGTTLASTLRGWDVDTVVLCGLSTSGCVRASGVDAVQHGFRPMVVAEACGDRAKAPHDAALFDLAAKYADVVSEAEAIAQFSISGA